MASLIDAHCHLADPKFRGDLEPVIGRARQAGVKRIIAVGAIGAIETDRLTVEIAASHSQIFAVIGVHPHDAREAGNERIEALRALARSDKVVAIGESGLDFHYMHSPPQAQEDSLRRHLELADDLGLPIVIHCRGGEARLVEIVRETGMPKAGGMIHCFTGDAAAARAFLALGFYLSFSGILTFKNAGALRDAAQIVPDDRLLIETDAPYLAPVPHRGARNEPALIQCTLEALARVRDADHATLAANIAANASRLLRLPEA